MARKHRFVENPNYAGKTPKRLTPACHDKSPMIDVLCSSCDNTDHLHETLLTSVPADAMVGCRCQACGHIQEFEAAYLRAGFTEMRKLGWIT